MILPAAVMTVIGFGSRPESRRRPRPRRDFFRRPIFRPSADDRAVPAVIWHETS